MARSATPNNIARILRHQVERHLDAPAQAVLLPPVMIWGPPGVGKSAIIRDLCEEKGIGFVDIRLSQREPVDLRGLPVPREDRVDWLLSGEWPRDPASAGIILLDELTAADRSLQVAAYELILDRRLGDLYELPRGWMVVAAGNRVEDRAVAGMFSSALANRFCHLEMAADLDDWLRWANASGVHADVMAFLRFQPRAFFDMTGNVEQGWPSPRSWERVSQVLQQLGDALPAASLNAMVEGLIGTGAATEFLAFREQSRLLPDVAAMLDSRHPIVIPERADQRYAFASALARHVWPGPTAVESDRLARFFQISEQLPSDFATLALLDLMEAGEPGVREQRMGRVFAHSLFNDWSERHGAVFAEHFHANETRRCA